MKSQLLGVIVTIASVINANAQTGIGTVTPNSTLDVRGSLSLNYRAFSTAATAGATDNILVFTGAAPATLTLPDATTCTGRTYWIKSSSAFLLTIATVSSQTIDGLAAWTFPEINKGIALVSDGTNWMVTAESIPGAGSAWLPGGNAVASAQNIGTTSNFDLPFITNNTEKMRLSSGGNLGIGVVSFNATNPEKLVADVGATGNTSFQNVIVGKGNTNSYSQLNIQNSNAGTNASSDVVATADNGNETINYIDMGINSSANTSAVFGGADDAYLYNVGQNLLIGTATAAKSLAFLTGGTTQSTNERMRISGTGLVGIGVNSPNSTLDVVGSAGNSITTTISNITLAATHYTVILTGGTPSVTLPAAGSTNTRRIYIIVNQTGAARTVTSYKDFNGANVTTVATISSITLQSDGSNWYRIR